MRLELGPIIRSAGRRRGALMLVVLEFAAGFTIISCLFLVGAWYHQVGAVHTGPHEDELVQVSLQRPVAATDALAHAREWQARAADTITATPGVVATAMVNSSLLDERMSQPVNFRSATGTASGWTVRAGVELPAVLGLRLLEGAAAAREGDLLVTRCLREALFPGGTPAVGQRISSGELAAGTVVGVVEDVYMRRAFMPRTNCQAFQFDGASDEHGARYLVRTAAASRAQVAAALHTRLVGLSGRDGFVEVKVYAPESARQYIVTRGINMMLVLLGINVAFVALLGPVAVSSFLVAERTRQIGVRRALGATRADIIRYFLVESALAIAAGTGLGIAFTVPFFLFMRSAFYSATLSSWALILTAALLFVDGTLAALLPALRASRVAPSVAARSL